MFIFLEIVKEQCMDIASLTSKGRVQLCTIRKMVFSDVGHLFLQAGRHLKTGAPPRIIDTGAMVVFRLRR